MSIKQRTQRRCEMEGESRKCCRHCEERSDEAIHLRCVMDCFAALAMTVASGTGQLQLAALEYWMPPALAGVTAVVHPRRRYSLPLARMKSKSQPSSACKMVSLNRCA